jgi:hypothetical protein
VQQTGRDGKGIAGTARDEDVKALQALGLQTERL